MTRQPGNKPNSGNMGSALHPSGRADAGRYHPPMAAMALQFRVAGFVLIAAGLAIAATGNVTRVGVNDADLAPTALVGFVLVALGSFGLLSAYLGRTGQTRWLLLPAILALLVVGGVGTMLVDQAHPSEYARGLRGPLGYVVFAGFGVCYVTVILTFAYAMVAGGAYALSWLLDLLPPLQSRGIGTSIRRTWRSPFKDPS